MEPNAYSAAMPGRFHLPARALGYHLVMDYRADQLGIQANSGGALLAEGTWSCPAMPGPLITATAGHRAGTITKDLYAARIASRAPYRLKRKDGPDHDGYQRLSCPATGSYPGIICPLRETSLTPRDGRAKILDPPADPPRICRQKTITIAPDTGARHRQDLAFGSETWARRYATLRNTIEGLNGFVKDPATKPSASPPARPRHRRLRPLQRPAAHGRQPPQNPRLAGTSRRQQSQQQHPARTPTANQPPRPPARRLAAPDSRHHHDPPAASHINHAQHTGRRPAGNPHPPRNRPCRPATPSTGPSDPPAILKTGHQHSSVGTTPAVLSVTRGVSEGIRTPDIQDHNLAL